MKSSVLYLVDTAKLLSSLQNEGMGDRTSAICYDAMKAITALQGTLNRNAPCLYLLTEPHDFFWLEYMSEEGKMLSHFRREILTTFDEVVRVFEKEIADFGLVLWDDAVPATANVAGTIAGVKDVIPVRGDEREGSIFSRLVSMTGCAVKFDLRNKFTGNGTIPDTTRPSSGSAKCDAYLWAAEKYLDCTNDSILFYTLDGRGWGEQGGEPTYPDIGNAFVYNQDYAVFKRVFVLDLSCWGDEVPCDDPSQPIGADLSTLKEILQRQYDRTKGQKMITVCGFVPWHVKYTRHAQKGKHGEVESEWEFTEILSAYNCIKDADAAGYCSLPNASVYCQYPLKSSYRNRRPAAIAEYDPNRHYILMYVGDYDASSWTARFIPQWYKDPAIGQIPMMWCFNPNLSDRIPQAFDFIYSHYTEQDYFAAGDSGAGYNNPRLCYENRVHSNNPSCIDVWNAHNLAYFARFDLDIIGFVIDGKELISEREMRDMSLYATRGVGYLSLGQDLPIKIIGGTTFVPVTSDVASEGTSASDAAHMIVDCIKRGNPSKRFWMFRTILVPPSRMKDIFDAVKALAPENDICFTDPHSFFALAKQAKEKGLTY